MRRSSSRWVASVTAIGLITALAGCSSDPASPPPTTAATPTTVPRSDDGMLTIGVLTPQGSANADIGDAIRSAVKLAVDSINGAGGYHGHDVVLVSEDEGVSGAGADPAISALLRQNVDAIVGPASSINALSGLSEIVNAGVVSCSPTATTSLLDNFPDHNLFFRTIPSDTLQAMASPEAVDRTGASDAAVAYIDDDYGQSFVASVQASLQRKGINETVAVPYSSNNQSINAAAAKIASAAPGVVVVIGDATSGPVMLAAIDGQTHASRPVYVVNDAMRRPTASAQPLGGSLAARINGVSPLAISSDQKFLDQLGATQENPSPYAGNAYDCVNLITLAAITAGSTQPDAIAALIPVVSDGGTLCSTFVTCRTSLLAGSNIDYDGASGAISMNSAGDLAAATFELFGFDSTGRDVHRGTIPVRG